MSAQAMRETGDALPGRLGLRARMGVLLLLITSAPLAVAGTLLFAPYDGLSRVLLALGVVGAVGGVVALQYVLGVRATLAGVDAVRVHAEDAPGLVDCVEALAVEMDVEPPTLYVAALGAPNAFAAGRRGHGSVVLSRELLRELDRDEVVGVVAHELAHLRHRDSVLMTAATTIRQLVTAAVTLAVGWAVFVAAFGYELASEGRGPSGVDWERVLTALVGGVFVVTTNVYLLATMALSRHREFVADAAAVRAVGDHRGLVGALATIEAHARRASSDGDANPVVAALCIRGSVRSRAHGLFASHPPTEARIEALLREFED